MREVAGSIPVTPTKMKLIFLNTWGGKIFEPLINFVKQQSQTADIFCFQEIYNTTSSIKRYKDIRANLLDELIKILPDFQFLYSIEISGFDSDATSVNFNLSVGKTIFIKKNIRINSQEDILLYGNKTKTSLKKDFSNLPITIQSINFTVSEKDFTLVNIHGIAFPGTKLDTKLRLEHSVKIKGFLNSKNGPKIMVGDFNLLPQTQSIKLLEDDMRNLIKEFKIKKTRSNLNPYFGKSDFQKFADYTFVSSDVNVIDFQVPDVTISDHLPMILQFS